VLGRKLPRVTLEGFSYQTAPGAPLEVPRGQRVAAIRARKADERSRAAAKTAAKTARAADSAEPASSGRQPRRRPFRGRR
jgi:ATP-dependent RNA helicase RhlE